MQSCCGESRSHVAGTNTIERFYDALNGVRQSTLGCDAATGRLVTMQAAGSDTPFTWSYLAGSDMKQSLAYPNGFTACWTYGNRGELLEVNNASPTGTISEYVYTYDAAGRRVACAKSGTAFEQSDSVNYGYNKRSELTNATAAVDSVYRYGYDFDDIGNRKTSAERGTNSVYTANSLNQYASITNISTFQHSNLPTFQPTFDADGNQTLVKTATGIWQVVYNGENRPVLWAQGTNTISMAYDRMGRRVTKNTQRFVYEGNLQIADNSGNTYVWDCTENVATRPLMWLVLRSHVDGGSHGISSAYYTHDGNKNVSEVITSSSSLSAHYEYAPFGALTVSRGTSAAANPWRFSSEYAEDDTATIYYNYRHYEPVTGRWMSRDPGGEFMSLSLYVLLRNDTVYGFDYLGREDGCDTEANAAAAFNFSIDLGLGSLSGSAGGSKSVKRCKKDCTPCKKGYTIDTRVSWFGSMGGTWRVVLPPPLPPIPLDVGYSVGLDKTSRSFYDSCTDETEDKKCATFSISIFAQKCIKIGPWIKHCFKIDGTYKYSDCDSKPNDFSIGLSWEQCYGWNHAGGCISTRWSPWHGSW